MSEVSPKIKVICMNKVLLMGRLTRDPETRYSNSAEPMAIVRYSIAVSRRTRRENEPDADFINCVVFGKAGEFAEKYFRKGMMVGVSGRLNVSSYTDNAGQRRWSTEVIIEDQYFGESRASFESRSQAGGYNSGYPADAGGGYAPPPPPPQQYAQQQPPHGYAPQPSYPEYGDAPPPHALPPAQPQQQPPQQSRTATPQDSFFEVDQNLNDEDLPF